MSVPGPPIASILGTDPEGAVALAAAVAAGAALVLADRRRVALALGAAGLLALLALVLLVDADPVDLVGRRPVLVAGAAVVGLAAVVALGLLLRARAWLLAPLVLAVLPFRVPVPAGDETANLLVPLYAVIAGGCAAFALRALRGGGPARGEDDEPAEGVRGRPLRLALAAVLVLYAAQALYSTDVDEAVGNLTFFYVPFALLFVLLLDVRWTGLVLRRSFGVAVGLALLCAVVGVVEFATGHLLIANDKVLEANELKPYFRVNSLFFDPNIYGRFLALVMVALAAALLWSRRRSTAAIGAGVLAVLWLGLVLSLSQSSFGALLTGLAILAAVRWRVAPVVAAAAVVALVSVALVLLAPGALGLRSGSERALDRATSGRVGLVEGALRMIGDRPVAGFGSGSFAERYRAREGVRSADAAAISHTTPLTITAEQGAIGLLAYLLLLGTALLTLFRGLLAAVREGATQDPPLARAIVAAAFCGLVVHTYAYASFLEDPLTWVLLGAGAALAPAAAAAPARVRRETPNRTAPPLRRPATPAA